MSMRIKVTKFKRLSINNSKVVGLVAILLIAGVGIYLLAGSHAAGSYASASASSGTLTNGAVIVSDSGSANGSVVKFGGSTTVVLPSPGSWVNVTNNLANLPSQCGNLTLVSAIPYNNQVIAGVAGVGLYMTSNDGASWSEMGQGTGSASITNRPGYINFDLSHQGTFWESGIYGPGVFKTTDGGITFQQLGSTTHDDYVSVDYSDPSRLTLLAGGHETSQRIDKSTDGGQTWTNIWPNLPTTIGGSFTQYPIIINTQTYLVDANASWAGGNPGIYRTTNGGQTWTKVSSVNPNTVPLIASNGTIYWSIGSNLAKSTDNGQTWSEVGSNLLNVSPLQLPDGRIVSIDNANHLTVSSDGGQSWTEFGAPLPFTPNQGGNQVLTYSAPNNAFFMSQWDCSNNVLPNAIARLQ